MTTYYKAVSLDKTSHYDRSTRWRTGQWIEPDHADETHDAACGHGIHSSPTVLDAVGYQRGPSLYLEVEPDRILGRDGTKVRCNRVKAIRWLDQREIDRLAGFRLWEANHPHDPRHPPVPRTKRCLKRRLAEWARVRGSVRTSVRDSVRDSVRTSVMDSVRDSVRTSVMDSVRDSVRSGVRDSVWDSVWAYTGSLFPRIREWRGTYRPHPWKELRALWLDGYVPAIAGWSWRLWTIDGPVEGVEVPV